MKKIRDIQFSNCVMGDGSIYAFADAGGYPLKINPLTKETVLLNWKGIIEARVQIDSIIYDNHSIYMLELNGRRMVQYNIQEESIKSYYINLEGNAWGNFVLFTKIDQTIFIFPKRASCFYEVDLLNGQVVRNKTDFQDLFYSCAFRNGDAVCLFHEDGSKIWIFDLHEKTYNQYSLNQNLEDIVKVTEFDDNAYLVSRKGAIYSCRLSDYHIEKMRESDSKDSKWGNIAVTKKNIWLLPLLGSDIRVIDRESLTESVADEYPDDFIYRDIKGWSKYHGYAEDEDKYYYAPRLANYMLEINKKTGNGEWAKIAASLQKDILNMARENKQIVQEGYCDLHDFLMTICSKKHRS